MSTPPKLTLVDLQNPGPSTPQQKAKINWTLCFICQKNKLHEKLICPTQSKRKDVGSGYNTLAQNLAAFDELHLLPRTLPLESIDEGSGIEATMIAHDARYHQSCKLKYNTTELNRAKKTVRKAEVIRQKADEPPAMKRVRYRSPAIAKNATCFFCNKEAGREGLHDASTFELDARVRACAQLIEDNSLLGRLSAGDMVALEAKYHTTCLVDLYNKSRKSKSGESKPNDHDNSLHAYVFAELIMHIEEVHEDNETSPVFKLADLASLYSSRLHHLGVQIHGRVHTTRLKQRILAHFPDMRAYTKGRDILLAFNEDVGSAILKDCKVDDDNDAVQLARAAQIVRRQMFSEPKKFTGFSSTCQEDSVPPSLLALVNMILDGPCLNRNQLEDNSTAALTIAQLLKFNSVKHRRNSRKPSPPATIRHCPSQETPVSIYLGLMLHAQTRKRELIEKLYNLGISISYDRVLQLSTQLGNKVCQQFHQQKVVCPAVMKHGIFTSAAVDNIDHNPSSTTSKGSFHGTAISIFQHPAFPGAGTPQTIEITNDSQQSCANKKLYPLPCSYTDIPPVDGTFKKSIALPPCLVPITRDGFPQHIQEEYLWLQNIYEQLQDTAQDPKNVSWSSFHASRQNDENNIRSPNALLPLYLESAHTTAMIRHSMYIVQEAVNFLNPGQSAVITFDQPLFALAKNIQWKWPEMYGEKKLVVMLGGLHIEMASLKMLGNWLERSGWVEALVQAEITTEGTAQSFLKASHITRTRRAHQVTAAALYILLRRAYKRNCEVNPDEAAEFAEWCRCKADTYPQFKYWSIVLEMQLTIFVLVRSFRQSSFQMYLNALQELAPWFHALDHTNYSRWIAVHLRDMANLPTQHPEVYKNFNAGFFTVRKTMNTFSSIPIDQAHEQNNVLIKGDGGAIGLTEDPSALRRWMIAGPEVARVIAEFEEGKVQKRVWRDTRHHDQTSSVQEAFAKDVSSLVRTFENLGNPFQEDSMNLISLATKEIAGPEAVNIVRRIKVVGEEQFKAFTTDCIIHGTRNIDDTIHRNKFRVFTHEKLRRNHKTKNQVATLKNDVGLFSRLYIGCQTRGGDFDEFFRHENQECPPSLSDGQQLRLGTKSNILKCLEEYCTEQTNQPSCTCYILDGAVLVQMLKPTTTKNFEEYATEVFIPYISNQVQHFTRVDVVWDTYKQDSLKNFAREKRGTGIRIRVTPTSTIPHNWQSFLRNDQNKTELFTFLTHCAIQHFKNHGKEIIFTNGEGVQSTHRLGNLQSIAPCTHEEADTRMILHTHHAMQHEHKAVLIRTVDTDIVVLCISYVQEMAAGNELWLAFGTGKQFRYIAAHEIAAGIGPHKSRALPMFHALTGCDTVSCFAGHGKKTAWDIWSVFPELTEALIKVSSAPLSVPDDVFTCIERFVILMYDRTSISSDIHETRKKLFIKKSNVQLIPPTRAALKEHIRRATYQGSHVWGQVNIPMPVLPSPIQWGWVKNHTGGYEPLWTTLPEAAKTCQELIFCKCKKACDRRCSCKKSDLPCTAMCLCEGLCFSLCDM